MWIFKRARFWLVWILAAPFIGLYLVGAAVFSGQWRLIWIKFHLIQQSLYRQFIKTRGNGFV